MDTRVKIMTADEALRLCGPDALAVFATFDVLTAARVERLRHLASQGGPLAALVALHGPEHSPCLLPQRARAELAAALVMVQAVVLEDETQTYAALRNRFPNMLDERENDGQITQTLIAHIRHKHEAPR